MAKRIAQFRLPEDKDDSIYSDENTWSTNILKGPTTQLSIYGLPGTRFKIGETADDFILNNTGLFSIDLDELSPITQLYIDKTSYKNIVESPNGAHLLVIDYVYITDEEAQN